MKPFKRGAFLLAVSQQVPIQPVSFTTNWKLFATESDPFGAGRPGIAKVVVHPSIPTALKAEKDIPALMELTYQTIQRAIDQSNNY